LVNLRTKEVVPASELPDTEAPMTPSFDGKSFLFVENGIVRRWSPTSHSLKDTTEVYDLRQMAAGATGDRWQWAEEKSLRVREKRDGFLSISGHSRTDLVTLDIDVNKSPHEKQVRMPGGSLGRDVSDNKKFKL